MTLHDLATGMRPKSKLTSSPIASGSPLPAIHFRFGARPWLSIPSVDAEPASDQQLLRLNVPA
jgi:hypothetical protein